MATNKDVLEEQVKFLVKENSKIKAELADMKRKNDTLKESLTFIHEKYPFLWENTTFEQKEEKFQEVKTNAKI